MSHQVSPTSYRIGKTFVWQSNTLSNRGYINTNASLKNGVENLLKHKLRRKRLFIAKVSVRVSNNVYTVLGLFMPRMKLRPSSESLGEFTNYVLYKKYNWNNLKFFNIVHRYADNRRTKTYVFPRQKSLQINKWISRRMFRGCVDSKYLQQYKLLSVKSNLKKIRKQRWISKKRRIYEWIRKLKNHNMNREKIKHKLKLQFKKRKLMRIVKKYKIYKKQNYNIFISKFSYRKYYSKWIWSRTKTKQQFIQQKLSHYFSSVLNERINLQLLNIFYYMATKQMISYSTHQEHFWNYKFRRFRFQYDNYYDIINSFFILGLIKNSENLLLTILRSMMPRIRKIKRFMYFLDAILKNMPQIQSNFSAFRVTITGKLRGGTKRTKVFSIGFGYLPFISSAIDGTTAFISYPHKFGEFGIKLIMNRTFSKIFKNSKKEWVTNTNPSPQSNIIELEKRRYQKYPLFRRRRKKYSTLQKRLIHRVTFKRVLVFNNKKIKKKKLKKKYRFWIKPEQTLYPNLYHQKVNFNKKWNKDSYWKPLAKMLYIKRFRWNKINKSKWKFSVIGPAMSKSRFKKLSQSKKKTNRKVLIGGLNRIKISVKKRLQNKVKKSNWKASTTNPNVIKSNINKLSLNKVNKPNWKDPSINSNTAKGNINKASLNKVKKSNWKASTTNPNVIKSNINKLSLNKVNKPNWKDASINSNTAKGNINKASLNKVKKSNWKASTTNPNVIKSNINKLSLNKVNKPNWKDASINSNTAKGNINKASLNKVKKSNWKDSSTNSNTAKGNISKSLVNKKKIKK